LYPVVPTFPLVCNKWWVACVLFYSFEVLARNVNRKAKHVIGSQIFLVV
jgi:hypothetical protein